MNGYDLMKLRQVVRHLNQMDPHPHRDDSLYILEQMLMTSTSGEAGYANVSASPFDAGCSGSPGATTHTPQPRVVSTVVPGVPCPHTPRGDQI